MRKTCQILTILMLAILIQSSMLNHETILALDEYKQLTAENIAYRTYRAESGLRGTCTYQFSDATGYRWYISTDDGVKIYIFNGVRYKDVMLTDHSAVRDTLLNALIQSKTTQTVYAAGRRNLYQWEGYSWKTYPFPKTDTILRVLCYDDDIYCLGEHGVGTLKQGIWTYQPFKGSINEAEAKLAHIGKDGSVNITALTNPQELTVKSGQNSLTRTSVLTPESGLYLKVITSKQSSSLPILSGKTIITGDEYQIPQTWYDYSGEMLWIFIAKTNLLYKYDLRKRKLQKITLAPGTTIQSIAGNSGSGWLITLNSGTIQATELPPGYPATKGRTLRSPELSFRADYLDYLYLNSQLLPVSTKYNNTYSDKYSLIRILEPSPGTNTLKVKELLNPHPGSSCKQIYNLGNLLLLDLKHDKFEDVSRVVVFKYPFAQTTIREITLDSENYSLAYNRQMDSIVYQRSGAITIIPLEIICEEIYQAPTRQKQRNYINITRLNDLRLISSTGLNGLANQLSLGRLKAGVFEQLAAVPFTKVIGTDSAAELVYLRSSGTGAGSEPDVLSAYSLKQAKLIELQNLSLNAKFYPFPGGYHSLDKESIITVSHAGGSVSPGPKGVSHPQKAFQNTVIKALSSDKLTKWQGKDQGKSLSSAVLDIVDHRALGDQWLGASFKRLSVSNQEIKPYSGQKNGKHKISDLSGEVHFSDLDGRTLNLPSYIYDLQNDRIYPKPMWIEFYPAYKQKHFVGHLEKLANGRYRYRVSQFSSGKLIPQKDDFTLKVTDAYVPAIAPFYCDAGQMYGDGKNLFYRHQKSWQTLSLKQFEQYGRLNNVSVLESVIWLCFTQALVRFDPDNKASYAYTSKEGIPRDMEEVFTENGMLRLKTWDTIFTFREYKNELKLDIPFILVSDSLQVSTAGKIRLPYTQRSLEIPINILGPLYPELCKITYRLRGFTDDWVTKSYMEMIQYEKLPYGSYVFEISAIAANGEQTPVQSIFIRINPPYYYSWYAFVIYALAFIGVIFVFVGWRIYRYRQINHQLEAQVALRTHELQEWQLRMTQSIEYALLIQKSILPQPEQMRRTWQEHFVMWHPRDVVGGDFYWLHELPGTQAVLFAVIDCTGHGVPGALVSMTVNAALNHIVTEHGTDSPDVILRQLHEDVGMTLHQESERTQQDGLDISMIKVDKAEHLLSFAGAALDLVVYDQTGSSMQVLKGSKFSIGGLKHHKNPAYDLQQVTYTPGSVVYLYTDGILDQPNEVKPRTKRLGPEQLYKLINELGSLPMLEQQKRLEHKLSQMLLLDSQRDDITIVGLQI